MGKKGRHTKQWKRIPDMKEEDEKSNGKDQEDRNTFKEHCFEESVRETVAELKSEDQDVPPRRDYGIAHACNEGRPLNMRCLGWAWG